MATLEEIRKKLLEKEPKNFSNSAAAKENYPFWNIPEGSTATVRFLPDGDDNNTFFWVEKQVIRLNFDGIKGGDNKEVYVEVPCVEMWDGMTCPVLSEVRPWFSKPELEATARKYWKKRSYIFQGFIVNDPIGEEKPENPIRKFVINKSIYELVKAALVNTEIENNPTDYIAGRDFKITKTKRGQYADYSTSSWSMKVRALSEQELEAIANPNFGLRKLSDYLPAKPDTRGLSIIKEMFEASVNGEAYDEARWSAYYKPRNFGGAAAASGDEPDMDASPKAAPKATPSAAMAKLKAQSEESTQQSETPASPAADSSSAATTGKPDPKAILDMIRKRNAAPSAG
jgi:hypothetical protein